MCTEQQTEDDIMRAHRLSKVSLSREANTLYFVSGTLLGPIKARILPVKHTVNTQTTQRPLVEQLTVAQGRARVSRVNREQSAPQFTV